jgi:RNA polymerase sigma-70 factor, ECF subfamily
MVHSSTGTMSLTATPKMTESMAGVDAGCFGEVYRQNLRPVWQVLRRLGVQDSAVDDATQDVFITAYRRWNDFEGRSSVRTWLLGIALKVASEHRRRVKPFEALPAELPASCLSPDTEVERREQVATLSRLLNLLPTEQRELLVLVELEGYSVPEVADATGLNLNTLYTRLRTARLRFQVLLGGTR